MRFVSFVAAGLALFVTSAAQAQLFQEWPSRDDRFVVNFPGEPAKTETPYNTPKGKMLTAHVYTADAPATSIQAGTYSVTVIDYTSAADEQATAIEDAAKMLRAKGTVKYDGANNVDQMASLRLTIETAERRRILAEILMSNEKRLYIILADTPVNIPPPAQFQASIQILDQDGVRIRYRTVGSTERVR